MEMELHYYQSVAGRQPFVEWMEGLKDARSRAKIEIRLARVVAGNFGDVKSVGDGVMELRIDWGPGYRIYFARVGRTVILLLGGGDKSSQAEDIQRAKIRFKDFKNRAEKENAGVRA